MGMFNLENHFYFDTKIGTIRIAENGTAITEVRFCKQPCAEQQTCETPLLKEAFAQLNEYFTGTRTEFHLPLAPQGTPFQQAVWKTLCTIPYGETRSYLQIAQLIGNPKACRAVGMANHKNPIGIIIPCHRVIGKNGKLTGYAGGLDKKANLLLLEQQHRKNREENKC